MHTTATNGDTATRPEALTLLASERPRNVGWLQAGGLLFGDWGTSRLYVLGLALFYAGRTSLWLIAMMSLLILGVGWAYSQICRIYPDGGGVYTAAKKTSRTLAVVGALLLFADYTVTASLSCLDAFHYFGLPLHHDQSVDVPKIPLGKAQVSTADYNTDPTIDAGNQIDINRESPSSAKETLFAWDSPGLWAIVSIILIGAFNMMGPKHTGMFAFLAAAGMVFITLLISAFALPKVPWHEIPKLIAAPDFRHPGDIGLAFVSIVLAISGVEAIANLTGVMKRPVPSTARKAIFVVALEVAIFNVILGLCMLAIYPINRDGHLADMAAFLTRYYVGPLAEWVVRMIGGVLLLSAGNTAITDMISIQYLMARDGELPTPLVRLNRFGVPWLPAVLASFVPILVLFVSHNLDALADLYAIGVVGAVAINITLCAIHPRLRKFYRKIPMFFMSFVMLVIWVTVGYKKHEALIFVSIVLTVGLSARQLNKWMASRKGPRLSLLRQAIQEQLGAGALSRPRVLLGTYGSDSLARLALTEAKATGSTLVVCFIRSINLSYKWDRQLTMESDQAAIRTFARFLDIGHELGVPVLPIYDSGPNPAELIAEAAAISGCDRVLIGSSRRSSVYQFIKGSFQQKLEALLPPEIKVEVLHAEGPLEQAVAAGQA
ncbi:MAG TPA: amino acid permease [Tepidisphaeraceae bacterium]|nr:amino acid permease [Tepidisphaeraceae bacterium]